MVHAQWTSARSPALNATDSFMTMDAPVSAFDVCRRRGDGTEVGRPVAAAIGDVAISTSSGCLGMSFVMVALARPTAEGVAVEAIPMDVAADDGAKLAVWASGPPIAETVLLLHGFSLDHTTWDEIAQSLVSNGFRVVTTDLRGHGRSSLGESSPSVDRLIADIAEIISTLELPPVHLVGHSLGAFVALSARSNDRLRASTRSVTSIAGTEQSIQNDPVMRIGSALFSSTLGLWLLGRERTGRSMISTWFGKDPSTADLDRIRLLYLQCDRRTRSAVAKATRGIDLRPTFATAGPPTLIMCGRDDKTPPLKQTERIASAIAGAELAAIESAGHMVIVEQPHAIVDRMSEWFARA